MTCVAESLVERPFELPVGKVGRDVQECRALAR